MKKIIIPLFLLIIIFSTTCFSSQQPIQKSIYQNKITINNNSILAITATSQTITEKDLPNQAGPIEIGKMVSELINDNSNLSSFCAVSRKGPSFQQLLLTFTTPRTRIENEQIQDDALTVTYQRLVTVDDKENQDNNKSIFNNITTIEAKHNQVQQKALATLAVSTQMLFIKDHEAIESSKLMHPRDIKKLSDIVHVLKNGRFKWNKTQKFTVIETEDDI